MVYLKLKFQQLTIDGMKSLFKCLTALFVAFVCVSTGLSIDPILCKLIGWQKLIATAGSAHIAKIDDLIDEGLIVRSTRYSGGGPNTEKLIWANQDYTRAFVEAGDISGQKVGPKGAEKFVESLCREKVVESIDGLTGHHLDYGKMGRGLGRISEKITSDDKMEQLLKNVRRGIEETPFVKANRSEAHLFRDVDDLLEDDPPGGLKLMEALQGDRNGGIQYQTAISAKIHRRPNETVRMVEPDKIPNSGFAGTGVDTVTDLAYYNMGISNETIIGKLTDDFEVIKNGLDKAKREGVVYKLVYGSHRPPGAGPYPSPADLPFPDKNNDSRLANAVAEFNAKLKTLQPPREDLQITIGSNIDVELVDP